MASEILSGSLRVNGVINLRLHNSRKGAFGDAVGLGTALQDERSWV